MQEETEKREIPTPAILLTMLAQLNDKAFEKEAILQCEESGANIAKLQGFLAGVRKYKQLMRDNGYTFDIKFDGTTERKLSFFGEDGCELDLHELRVTVSDIDDLAESVAYDEFKELWHNAVETQKDWLFYTSEKGRNLHFAKGWYEAMTEIDNNMQRLHTALEAAEKEAASSLPFDDYDEDTGNN